MEKVNTKENVKQKPSNRLELANWFTQKFNSFLKETYLHPLDNETYLFTDTHENNEWEDLKVDQLITKFLDKLEKTHKLDILINPDDMAFDITDWSSSFNIRSYDGSWAIENFTHKGITYKLQMAIF